MDSEGAIGQFLEESYSHIENFEQGLLTLEKNCLQQEYLRALYRCMHTIKGSAGFFNFKNLENIVHKTEDIFSYLLKIEDEKRIDLIKKNNLTNLFFRVNDEIRKLLNLIKDKNLDKSHSAEILLHDLTNYNLEIFSNKELSITLKTPSKNLNPNQLKAIENLRQSMKNDSNTNVYNKLDNEVKNVDIINLDDNILIKQNTLEALSSLSAELIIARNQIESVINSEFQISTKLHSDFYKIDQLVNHLNEKISQIRLQPLSKITDKLKRVVRDLALSCDKAVDLEIFGENVEIDRGILEVIKDPLVHLLRNAIDHGIETKEERIKKGKDILSTITIRAAYDDNSVKLSVTDDGRGINLKKIINKALENNLITRENLKTIVRKDLLNLIFHPGFSTKSEVTNISGRGIGMNVVKDSISKVNGSIEINTAEDYGTEFLIKMPVSLTLRASIIVEVEGQIYAIPTSFIKDMNNIKLNEIYGKEFIEIRGEYFKIIFAKNLLTNESNDRNSNEEFEYLMIDTGDSKFIFIVDSILDMQNLIIKPYPDQIYNPGYISGTAILPDGKTALVFDLDEVYDCYKSQDNLYCSTPLNNFLLFKPNRSSIKKILSFYVGDLHCAVNYDCVKEAIPYRIFTRIPDTEIESLINLRGQIIPIKNIKRLLRNNVNLSDNEIAIVLELNKNLFAIKVDDLGEIIEVNEDLIDGSKLESEFKPFFKRIYNINDSKIYLLKEEVLMKAR